MGTPMPIVQPQTFVFTATEAAQVQSIQLAQQQKVAGTSGVTRYGSIAVPIVMVASVAAVDQIWYAGKMPGSLFVTLLAFYLVGMVTMLVGYALNLRAAKQRIIEKTRQVFEPRTVRFTDEGIEQSLPELRALHLWRGIDRIEQASGIILIWDGNLLASAIPTRAFPSEPDAQAFADACRQRAGASHAAATAC
jgi:hypothetical protein